MNFTPSTLAQELNSQSSPSAQYVYASDAPTIVQVGRFDPCSCVSYGKAILGITESLGIAGHIQPTHLYPYIGGLVITLEGQYGHVAIIRDIDYFTGELIVDESNFKHCEVTYGRRISLSNPLIKGYR